MFVLLALGFCPSLPGAGLALFNVKDYGATGKKSDDARPAIQKTIDACTAAGGGVVYLPPGDYTSGTLHLRSHVRFEIEAGATLFASSDPKAYDFGKVPSKAALFFGEDLENISIGGQGTVEGQAEYEWRQDDFEKHFDHKTLMQSLGKSLQRPFPKGFPQRDVLPHLVWLGRCKDVRITSLSFLHSPTWTLTFYGCERVALDGLYVFSSLAEAVWADGIDLDGCKDVSISNCTIETGDDCLVFISENSWGPPLECENITVSNCRLSSASAGIKFSEGNRLGIRRVLVNNTIFPRVNRGLVFLAMLGGQISDVVLSDLVINCQRFDWFWAGDGQPFHFRVLRPSEANQEAPAPGEPVPGSIRNITIRNVIAHAKGSSRIHGSSESRLDGLSFENIKLFLSTDPAAPYDVATNALSFRWAKNLKVKDVEVSWEKPALEAWQSALYFEEVNGLRLDGFTGRGGRLDRATPAVVLKQVADALVCHSRAVDSTTVFVRVTGPDSRDICLQENDLRRAKVPVQLDRGVKKGVVRTVGNILSK
jgi:hypothetical protein